MLPSKFTSVTLTVLLSLGVVAEARADNRASAELNALCQNVANNFRCAQVIERHQLRRREYAGLVSRVRTGLRLRLRGGRFVTLRNGETEHLFREYLRDTGYFLVHHQYYEGNNYLMVHDVTGQRQLIPSLPTISPDKQRLVAVYDGEEADSYAEVWRLTSRGMVRERRIELTEGQGYFDDNGVSWSDNQTIILTKNLSPETDPSNRTIPVTLRLRSGRWVAESAN